MALEIVPAMRVGVVGVGVLLLLHTSSCDQDTSR
jgi:hypothetical protein